MARRRSKPREVLHGAESTINVVDRIFSRLIIIGFGIVEGYKYIRWLLEH